MVYFVGYKLFRNGGSHIYEIHRYSQKSELGRIVLPIELRRTLDIAEKDALEIFVEGDNIILHKYHPSCVFCENTKNIISYKGKNVCPDCIKKLKEKI